MDKVLRDYQKHTLHLKELNALISEYSTLAKRIPITCPARRHVLLSLDEVRQIKRDIINDINVIADNLPMIRSVSE